MRRLIRSFFRKKGYDIIKFKKENMGLYPYYDMSKFVKTHKAVLFDVGANLGQTVKDFNEVFPEATIYAFEPTPDSFKILQNKTSNVKDLHLNNYAVGSTEEELYLNQYHLSNTNSFFDIHLNNSTELKSKQRVKTITIDGFVEKHQIDFIDVLKIDTEGYDLEVLKGSVKAFKDFKVGMLLVEIHFVPRHPDIPRFTRLLDFALDHDFELVSIYPVVHRRKMGAYTDVLFKHKKY